MAFPYQNLNNLAGLSTKGGFGNTILLAPKSWFNVIADPVGGAGAGNTKLITASHTFLATKGFFKVKAKLHSVQATSESAGDPGALTLNNKLKYMIVGDNAAQQEQIEAMLNDEFIALLKDSECDATKPYQQLGCDCNSLVVAKLGFDSKTTKDGAKEYELEMEVPSCRYYYSGTVTMLP
jgi:hypothetical protein